MGDPARFRAFACLISRSIPADARIADVAGGKGQLQAALRQLGFRDVTSWDKRPRYARGRRGYHYGYFHHQGMPRYDAVVALHPDQGTDHALLYCLERGVPGLICPCCVMPSAVTYGGVPGSYRDWCRHLEGLVKEARVPFSWEKLPMRGRNRVLLVGECR